MPDLQMWNQWVIDASMGCEHGLFTFCPIEGDIDGDYKIVIGFNYVSPVIPTGMNLVAIVHPAGPAAHRKFCARYEREIERIREHQAHEYAEASFMRNEHIV